MTLDTRIYVEDRADYREVFAKCNQLIGATEQTRYRDENGTIMNEPGQGLPGWLMLRYRDDAPLIAEGESLAHGEYCDPDCDGTGHERQCWLRVSLDTAYSYSDSLGGCGDLHARFVAALGAWLDGKGIRWSWRNEFTE
jgi:hypothetical protein